MIFKQKVKWYQPINVGQIHVIWAIYFLMDNKEGGRTFEPPSNRFLCVCVWQFNLDFFAWKEDGKVAIWENGLASLFDVFKLI